MSRSDWTTPDFSAASAFLNHADSSMAEPLLGEERAPRRRRRDGRQYPFGPLRDLGGLPLAVNLGAVFGARVVHGDYLVKSHWRKVELRQLENAGLPCSELLVVEVLVRVARVAREQPEEVVVSVRVYIPADGVDAIIGALFGLAVDVLDGIHATLVDLRDHGADQMGTVGRPGADDATTARGDRVVADIQVVPPVRWRAHGGAAAPPGLGVSSPVSLPLPPHPPPVPSRPSSTPANVNSYTL